MCEAEGSGNTYLAILRLSAAGPSLSAASNRILIPEFFPETHWPKYRRLTNEIPWLGLNLVEGMGDAV